MIDPKTSNATFTTTVVVVQYCTELLLTTIPEHSFLWQLQTTTTYRLSSRKGGCCRFRETVVYLQSSLSIVYQPIKTLQTKFWISVTAIGIREKEEEERRWETNRREKILRRCDQPFIIAQAKEFDYHPFKYNNTNTTKHLCIILNRAALSVSRTKIAWS